MKTLVKRQFIKVYNVGEMANKESREKPHLRVIRSGKEEDGDQEAPPITDPPINAHPEFSDQALAESIRSALQSANTNTTEPITIDEGAIAHTFKRFLEHNKETEKRDSIRARKNLKRGKNVVDFKPHPE